MRHLVALLLLAACSSDPSPPVDASAADTSSADAPSSDGGAGSCPELARWCSQGIDLCANASGSGSDGDIRGCLRGASGCRPIPAACWTCPGGARIWRSEDVHAFAAAFGDGGVCQPVDGGVSDPHF